VKGNKRLPRLGFLGTGWIGRHRLEAVARSGEAEIAAIADICAENASRASLSAPGARLVATLDELLAMDLDGVVIATPNAQHSSQAVRALERGLAVFCQKPLARTAAEARLVVEAAQRANRLLAVDFSYRFTEGMRRIAHLIGSGELGAVYAADLVFHNAYGPDKEWFYDVALSGGGCLMDLGSHLLDLALWVLGFPKITTVSSAVYSGGRQLFEMDGKVEDFAFASYSLETGAVIRLACSWNLSAGRDAVIEANFFGTRGGASFRNVNGSFYDFEAERFSGTSREALAAPPDEWGGRAIVAWARTLGRGAGFDQSAERLVDLGAALDAAYGRVERL
jgi:predicted dehydrogenase